jgi:hypothetical protein
VLDLAVPVEEKDDGWMKREQAEKVRFGAPLCESTLNAPPAIQNFPLKLQAVKTVWVSTKGAID